MSEKEWFDNFRKSKHYTFLQKKPIAYFCIEYALSDLLPTYAGGLGVLAGDYVKELHDQKIPSVAVGLYYQSKYGVDNPASKGSLSRLALTQEQQGLKPVLGEDGKQILIKVPIYEKDIFVTAWVWDKGTIPVYLLDTNVTENDVEDRMIGFKLYDSNTETRLKQEIILGIGGFRLLEQMKIQPAIYHMNEGHSVFLDLEIIRHEMHKRGIGFHDALRLATHHVVFTNHTLLAAGNEVYSNDLFALMISRYASEVEVPVSDMVSLGIIPQSNSFSLSLCSLRLAGKINAVSQLHAKEAKKAWVNFSVEAVTNGIHLDSWDAVSKNTSLMTTHKENKKELLEYIKKTTGAHWSEDMLLIGWARRMVRYKRPLAIFEDIKHFKALARTKERPIRIVMAGIAHQGDNEGRELLQKLQQLIKKELADIVVYLPEYNTTLAKLLTSGCDVWLNTPVVGSEACGTSGMKAALNGVLPYSTKDGWIDEIDLSEIGWKIDSDTVHENVLTVLKNELLPTYYDHKPKWEIMMLNARSLIKSNFSTTRMLREYIEKMYMPIYTTSFFHYLS